MGYKKAIVSGGAGFIGSHLTEELLGAGWSVIVLDNLSNGRKENLRGLKKKKGLRVFEVDVSCFEDIKAYFKGTSCVFHLAALADIVPSIESPLQYHRANVDGTVSMLEAARSAGVKKFIYAASSSCYGIPDQYPTSETAGCKVEYPYALTKYIGEQYVLHWARVYNLPAVSLRLFNVYGPRSRTTGAYGAVFGVFLAQKLAGKKFTVVGDGNQTRDFIFVKDVVKAFISASRSDVSGDVFNVGSGAPQSVNRLAGLLGGEKEFIPKRPGEPDKTHADISKIKRILGWRPETSFEEGVSVMLKNIDYWRDAPVWTPKKIEKRTKEWFKHIGDKGK